MSVQDDDRDVFDAATSGEPPQVDETPVEEPVEASDTEEPEAEQEASEDKKTRNEKGQFTSKEASPEDPEQPEAEKPVEAEKPEPAPKQEDHRVPLTELLNEREKRQKLEAEARRWREQFEGLQKKQEQKPPPDMYEDPAGYQQYQQSSVQDAIRATKLEFSEQLARMKFGDEAYDAADAAANEIMASGNYDQGLAAVANSSNPGVALVQWHKAKMDQERIGSQGLDAFLEQQREQLMNDPDFIAKVMERTRATAPANPGSPKPEKKIPSLNRATSAQANETEAKDPSDAELFKSFG